MITSKKLLMVKRCGEIFGDDIVYLDFVRNFIFQMDTKKLILECQPNMSTFHEISHFEFPHILGIAKRK